MASPARSEPDPRDVAGPVADPVARVDPTSADPAAARVKRHIPEPPLIDSHGPARVKIGRAHV